MNPIRPFLAGVILLIIVIAGSFSADAQFSYSASAVQEPDKSWVQLTTGEYIFGEVQTPTVARVPNHVTVNNERYAQHSILGFRYEGQEYYILHSSMASARPILLREMTNGHVSLLAEVSAEGSPDFFRMQDGEIASISTRNLMRALGDHPEAMRHLQADRRYGTISVVSLAAGVAAVGTGAAMEWGMLPNSGSAGMYLAASGVLVAAGVNAIVPILRHNAKMRAIDAYNDSF